MSSFGCAENAEGEGFFIMLPVSMCFSMFSSKHITLPVPSEL